MVVDVVEFASLVVGKDGGRENGQSESEKLRGYHGMRDGKERKRGARTLPVLDIVETSFGVRDWMMGNGRRRNQRALYEKPRKILAAPRSLAEIHRERGCAWLGLVQPCGGSHPWR